MSYSYLPTVVDLIEIEFVEIGADAINGAVFLVLLLD